MRTNIVHIGAGELTYEIRNIVNVGEKLQKLGLKTNWENIGDPIAKGEKVPDWMKEIVVDAVRQDHTYGYSSTKGVLTTREFIADQTNKLGKVQIEIFEKTVEHRLMDPTFITEYPTEVSPLARRNDDNPFVTDRFEFFVTGRELANGFSELNDSEDQAERFAEQMRSKDAGDDEAMPFDHDYIRALEYGLPPTAGLGIGIDRTIMLFANVASIRDVLLFPHMRPENFG